MFVVNVSKHEVVVAGEHELWSFRGHSLSVFLVNIPRPGLAVSLDLVDGIRLRRSVVVNTGEVVEVPLHTRVLVTTARESEPETSAQTIPKRMSSLGPGFNVVLVANKLVALVTVHHGSKELLLFVRTSLVVQDRVNVRDDSLLLGRSDSRKELLLVAPVGALGSLLVKLAEIPEVVAVGCKQSALRRVCVTQRKSLEGVDQPSRVRLTRRSQCRWGKSPW